MAPIATQPTLTKEQLARFYMPFQDVMAEHRNQIPEVFEGTSSTSYSTNWISNLAGFFQNLGKFVGDSFMEFGYSIQSTITTIVVLLILLVCLYIFCRVCPRRTKIQRCSHTDSYPENWKFVPAKTY